MKKNIIPVYRHGYCFNFAFVNAVFGMGAGRGESRLDKQFNR